MVIGYIFGVVFSLYTACVVTRVNHSWVEIKLYYATSHKVCIHVYAFTSILNIFTEKAHNGPKGTTHVA